MSPVPQVCLALLVSPVSQMSLVARCQDASGVVGVGGAAGALGAENASGGESGPRVTQGRLEGGGVVESGSLNQGLSPASKWSPRRIARPV